MKFFFACLLLFAATSSAFSQTAWNISDYFNNLPSDYKTFYGDFGDFGEKNKIIDKKNGYAALLESPSESFAVFEMALFKPRRGLPVLVVSNHQSDAVCVFYDTFFLKKSGSRWINVKSQVLPKITDEMFFTNPRYAKKFAELQRKYGDSIGGLDYHFQPPRYGTKMKVSPVFCDWVDDQIASKAEVRDYGKVMKSAKSIYLQWNKSNGKFEFAK